MGPVLPLYLISSNRVKSLNHSRLFTFPNTYSIFHASVVTSAVPSNCSISMVNIPLPTITWHLYFSPQLNIILSLFKSLWQFAHTHLWHIACVLVLSLFMQISYILVRISFSKIGTMLYLVLMTQNQNSINIFEFNFNQLFCDIYMFSWNEKTYTLLFN